MLLLVALLPLCLGEAPLSPVVFVDGDDVDGERNAAVTSPLASVVDHGAHAEALVQATASKRPALVVDCLGEHDCIASDGVDVVAKSTAADWIFLHDGSGATVYVVAAWDDPVGDTTTFAVHTGGGANAGIGVGIDSRLARGNDLARLLVGPNVLDTDHDTPDDTLPAGSGFHIVTAKIVDGAGVDGFIRVDGQQVNAEPAINAWSSALPLYALRVGAIKGRTLAALVYDEAHSVAEVREVEDWLRCRYFSAPARNLAFYGDSLCAIRAPVVEWPRKVKDSGVAPFEVENRCVRGLDAAEILAAFAAFDEEEQQRYGVLTVGGGTNDLYDGVRDAPAAFAELESLWNAARSRTMKLVATTVPPFGGSTAQELERAALNALIRASPLPDAVLDLDALWSAAGMLGADGIHPTEAGTSAAAAEWLALFHAP